MARNKDQDLILKWKKKKWFPLLAPEIFGSGKIGELIAETPEQTVGKTVVINYKIVSGSPQKQRINLVLKVVGTEGSNLKTELVGWEIMASMLKRIVRKRRERIDDSFVVKTKDDKYVQLKPLIITLVSASRSVNTQLMKFTKKYLVDFVTKKTYKDFVQSIVNETLQRDLKAKLNKILPIQFLDLRVFKLLENPTNKVIKKANDVLNEVKNYEFNEKKVEKEEKSE